MNCEEIIKELKKNSNPKCVEGMARFGINPNNTLGVNLPTIRKIAKDVGKDHKLALELWKSGIHEAKILASMVDSAEFVTEEQMEDWVRDFDSWDVCDQCCMVLFDKTPFAYKKVVEWSRRKEEFVKRAAFALIASLTIHDKKADDGKFEKFLPIIKREATDERNFVKKAVNWALRSIGKRNIRLNKEAIKVAEEIKKIDSKTAKWIASNALAELKKKKIVIREISNN